MGSQIRSTFGGSAFTKSHFGRDTLVNDEIEELTTDLLPFVLQNQEKVNNQCRYSKIDFLELVDLARELLLIYGDSVKEAHVQNFVDYLNSQQIRADASVLTTDFLPVRTQALCTYLQRILRPIWHTKLTHRKSVSDFSKQLPNIELFLPALARLQNLYNFIEANF